MPTPIDHRDVTLTESGRPTNYKHTVLVHLDTVSIASGVTKALYNTLVTDSNAEDKTRHELRLSASGGLAASIFWDSELTFTPTGSGVQSTKTATTNIAPTPLGSVTSPRPTTVVNEWTQDPLPGPWDLAFFVWTTSSNCTVTLTETTQSSGKTWAIRVVTQSGVTKYTGNLVVTFTSTVTFVFASLTDKQRGAVQRLASNTLRPSASAAAKAPTAKKPAKKAAKRVAKKKR